jgi:hypothetical protein
MATTYTKERTPDHLLKEDSGFLLLENGGKIVLRRGYVKTDYTKETKP